LTLKNDKAINHKLDKIVSDHNIFYPEQEGFLSIKNIEYNNLSAFQDEYDLDLHSFISNPLFIDVYNNNFDVEPGSPAINKGILVGLTQDISSELVPQGDAPDIGVFEHETGNFPLIQQEVNAHDGSFVEIFPNPSNGQFTIDARRETSQLGKIKVIDISGREVYSEVNNASIEGGNTKFINLMNIPKGIYILMLGFSDFTLSEQIVIE
jgi:hypothetical protein